MYYFLFVRLSVNMSVLYSPLLIHLSLSLYSALCFGYGVYSGILTNLGMTKTTHCDVFNNILLLYSRPSCEPFMRPSLST